jgi:hypothetical protein
LYRRLVLTFLAAACLGALVQGIALILWTTHHGNGSPRKFVVAPAAPIIGGASIGTRMTQRRDGDRTHRAVMIRGAGTVVPSPAATFGTSAMRHGGDFGWDVDARLPFARFAPTTCLMIPSDIMMMAALAITAAGTRRAPGSLTMVSEACPIAAPLGTDLANARLEAEKPEPSDMPVLTVVHAPGVSARAPTSPSSRP